MKNLSVKFCGHNFQSPLVLSSGTASYGFKLKGFVDFKKIGALTTKTITLKPKVGNPPPRLIEADCGLINSIGLENKGLNWLKNEFGRIKKLPVPVIVSFAGENKEEFFSLAQELGKFKGLRFIEVNLSCPNLKKKKLFAQSASEVFHIIKGIRKRTNQVIIAKLSPEVTDIVAVAKKAMLAGADALSLTNTFFALRIDINTRISLLGKNFSGGLSGPAIKPLALYRLHQIYQKLKVPLIAGGGIMNWQDALEFIICGATLVGVGTANLVNPQAANVIYKGIAEFLRQKKITSLAEIRGSLKERSL